jgi:hypothetical protein
MLENMQPDLLEQAKLVVSQNKERVSEMAEADRLAYLDSLQRELERMRLRKASIKQEKEIRARMSDPTPMIRH